MTDHIKNLSRLGFLKGRKALLISPELCTGCRGCQSACKEWNKLPAERTRNLGTYENPPDLTPKLYNRIRFVEAPRKSGLNWLFISQRCMHCGDAGCMAICPAPGALYRNGLGFVIFNKDLCIGCKLCRAVCPFDIPRYDAADKVSKCHLCSDRVENGLIPACAKICPTGAISYGNRDDLIAQAGSAGCKTLYGQADLAGLGVLYAFREKPEYYGFPSSPTIPGSVSLWRSLLKPLAFVGLGATVAATAVHYLAYGPHDSGDNDKGGKAE